MKGIFYNKSKDKGQKLRLQNQEKVLCAFFAALIAIGAFIRIPIPYVPFTLQFLFTNLAGLLLGARKGFWAVGIYIILGLVGLPVFTSGGGIGYVLQPTFGYIIGFALGAYISGKITRKMGFASLKNFLLAGFVNLSLVYTVGFMYYFAIAKLYMGKEVSLPVLLLYGVVLAVPGDAVLCVVSAFLAKRLYPIVRKGIS